MSSLIQIGSNVGDEYIFKLIEDKKINLCVFIDANEKALEKCRENVSKFFEGKNIDWEMKCEYIICAISNSKKKEVELNIPIGDDYSNHSSLDASFPTIADAKNGFESVKVLNYSINNIFDEFNLVNIEYLFIDVEGADHGILMDLDWNKYNIDNVKFEFAHWGGWQGYSIPENSANLNHFLYYLIVGRKYKVYQSSATDITATKIVNWVENYNDEDR